VFDKSLLANPASQMEVRVLPVLGKLTRAGFGIELELYWRSGCDD
jgi:hypothetical protein